jgi:hypothetical protein
MSAAAAAEELLSRSPERGGVGLELQQLQFHKLQRPALPEGVMPVFPEGVMPEFRERIRPEFTGKPVREGLLGKLDERLSIIVTDQASTSAITFSQVMDKLADDMRVDKLTLFRHWWDTADKTSGNPFCNSETQKLNGFPYQCPRAEAEQDNPFDGSDPCAGYTAIGFVNRFDLADKDRGQHCGEFRIVFARNSGLGAAQNCSAPRGKRLLIIFEALVPNPEPPHSPRTPNPDNIFVNLKGCRPIVEFWLGLSDSNMSTTDHGTALRDFFLKGLPDAKIAPVVDAKNYAGGPASGQIRTNQLMQPNWTLREFKTSNGRIIPATVKSNPGNSLFGKDSHKIEFADYLVRDDTLANLRGVTSAGETNIDTFAFGLTVPSVDHLNSFESQEELPSEGDVVKAFEDCRQLEPCREADAIENRIKTKLTEVGSLLSVDNIIHRIGTQTCAGCHHYSNGDTDLKVNCPNGWPSRLCFMAEDSGVEVRRGIWPSTLPDKDGKKGFTHVSEEEIETGTDSEVFDLARLDVITLQELIKIRPKRISHLDYRGPGHDNKRYKISETLKFLLIPPRFENMVLYLNELDPPP